MKILIFLFFVFIIVHSSDTKDNFLCSSEQVYNEILKKDRDGILPYKDSAGDTTTMLMFNSIQKTGYGKYALWNIRFINKKENIDKYGFERSLVEYDLINMKVRPIMQVRFLCNGDEYTRTSVMEDRWIEAKNFPDYNQQLIELRYSIMGY